MFDAAFKSQVHYEAYEKALHEGVTLSLRYLKFLFFGPPCSGKTSTRRRLVREIKNLSSMGILPSTRIAETTDVIIKKVACGSAAVLRSEWLKLTSEKSASEAEAKVSDNDFTSLAQVFYHMISTKEMHDSHLPSSEERDDDINISDNGHKLEHVEENQNAECNEVKLKPNATNFPSSQPSSQPVLSIEADLINTKQKLTTDDKELKEIESAFEKLSEILQADKEEKLQHLLKELMMINMIDAGGQPAFLDMLPALTVGPALYFIFFRLDQELKKLYPVSYRTSDGSEILLKSSYCIVDVIFQALSSIACFAFFQEDSIARGLSSTLALLFGTHKDQVSDKQIDQTEASLKEMFEKTKFLKEGLICRTSKGKLFYSVDNMNGNDTEIESIQEDLEGLLKHFFPEVQVPATWLMFRILLHLLHKPVVSLPQCKEIANRLKMSTPVQEALWFFHHQIGSVMYYPEITSMQDVVICDPQVVFDSVSEMIIDTFQISNRSIPAEAVDEFQQKGLFTLSHMEQTTNHCRKSHLAPKQLIDLLNHLNIVAVVETLPAKGTSSADHSSTETTHYSEFYSSNPASTRPSGNTNSPQICAAPSQPQLHKYFMPGALQIASEGSLQLKCVPDSDKVACPMMVHFKFGFVPFGVFCTMIANLVAQQAILAPEWKICGSEVKKNKVTFLVDHAYNVTLISRPKCLEIQVFRHSRAYSDLSLNEACIYVNETITESIEAVISQLKYKPYARVTTQVFTSMRSFDKAFTCCVEDSHSDHLMIVIEGNRDQLPQFAECLLQGIKLRLNPAHLIWFNSVRYLMCVWL